MSVRDRSRSFPVRRGARAFPGWALAVVVTAGLCAGCDPPSEEVFPPDATRTGLGNEGSYGARWIKTELRVRVDQTLPVDLFLPVGGEGIAEGSFPPVVLVQGGLVSVERYAWLGAHMATRGFVVVAPHHTGALAFFEAGNPLDTLLAARRASASGAGPLSGRVADVPGLVVGHSLGGVVAATTWASAPDELSHLVLLASIFDPGFDVGAREEGRVVSIVGTADGRISPEEVLAGAEAFAVPTVVATVAGMNHLQLTDDPSEAELQDDGEPTIPEALARARTLFLVDAALEELAGRDAAVLDQPEVWPAGIDPLLVTDPIASEGEAP